MILLAFDATALASLGETLRSSTESKNGADPAS